jgi:hypothetical protein
MKLISGSVGRRHQHQAEAEAKQQVCHDQSAGKLFTKLITLNIKIEKPYFVLIYLPSTCMYTEVVQQLCKVNKPQSRASWLLQFIVGTYIKFVSTVLQLLLNFLCRHNLFYHFFV